MVEVQPIIYAPVNVKKSLVNNQTLMIRYGEVDRTVTNRNKQSCFFILLEFFLNTELPLNKMITSYSMNNNCTFPLQFL